MSLRAELVRAGLRYFMKRDGEAGRNLAAARRQLSSMGRFAPNPPSTVDTHSVTVGGVPAQRVKPPGVEAGRQILYLHGGGYVSGSPELYRNLTWRIAAAARASLLCLDYRLAPEHPFPAAVDDAVAGYRTLLSEGAEPGQIGLVGDSAGGGLVFALLLRLRDEGLPLPGAAAAMSPWTDLAMTGPSMRLNAKADPMIEVEAMPPLVEYYLGGADPRAPYASPLYGDLRGLPPSLIQVGSDEVLLDDAARMAGRLRAAGSQAVLDVWPRMPHVWQAFAPLVPESRRAIARIGGFLREHTA